MMTVPLYVPGPIAVEHAQPPGSAAWLVESERFVWDGKFLWWYAPWGVELLTEIEQEAHAIQWSVGFYAGRAYPALASRTASGPRRRP